MKAPITTIFVLSSLLGTAQEATERDAKTERIRLNPEAYQQQGGELNDDLLLYRQTPKTPATTGEGFVIHHNLQVSNESEFDRLKAVDPEVYDANKQRWINENPAAYDSMQNLQEEPYRTPEERKSHVNHD